MPDLYRNSKGTKDNSSLQTRRIRADAGSCTPNYQSAKTRDKCDPAKIKGKIRQTNINWLKEEGHQKSLDKLRLGVYKREYAVWQKDSSVIDLFSPKFLRQKLSYIHLNPVRAELCEAPQDWKWSSYRAYFPHAEGEVPIEVDVNPYWPQD